jgi:hypothetical protein
LFVTDSRQLVDPRRRPRQSRPGIGPGILVQPAAVAAENADHLTEAPVERRVEARRGDVDQPRRKLRQQRLELEAIVKDLQRARVRARAPKEPHDQHGLHRDDEHHAGEEPRERKRCEKVHVSLLSSTGRRLRVNVPSIAHSAPARGRR